MGGQAGCLPHGEIPAGTCRESCAPGPRLLGYGLLISLGLVVFVAPFAGPWPDGLEAAAKSLGFAKQAAAPLIKGPVSEYRPPFIGSIAAATAVAGDIGAILALIGAFSWIKP